MAIGKNHEQSACGFFRTYIRSYQQFPSEINLAYFPCVLI
nr:MAG TPA: hypothetical protein [Caudoviricetes sp.]